MLASCALLAGDRDAAARYLAQAEDVALQWGNAVWARRAADRRAALAHP